MLERYKEIINEKQQRVSKMLTRYAAGNFSPNWPIFLGLVAEGDVDKAIWEVIHGNIPLAKQLFYNAARLIEVDVRIFNSRIFDYNIPCVGYALQSDNDTFIRQFAAARYTSGFNAELSMEEMVAGGHGPLVQHLMFMIILGNDEMIRRDLDIFENLFFKNNPRETGLRTDLQFLQSLYHGDMAGMQAALSDLLQPRVHAARNRHHSLRVKFISEPALTYAKLAWYKGYPVHVDSPLVPKDLLPVSPLPFYEEQYLFIDTLPEIDKSKPFI